MGRSPNDGIQMLVCWSRDGSPSEGFRKLELCSLNYLTPALLLLFNTILVLARFHVKSGLLVERVNIEVRMQTGLEAPGRLLGWQIRYTEFLLENMTLFYPRVPFQKK